MKKMNKVLFTIAILSLLLLTACGTKEKQDEFKIIQDNVNAAVYNLDEQGTYFAVKDYDTSKVYLEMARQNFLIMVENVEILEKDYDVIADKKMIGSIGSIVLARQKMMEANELFYAKGVGTLSTQQSIARSELVSKKYSEGADALELSINEIEQMPLEEKQYIKTNYDLDMDIVLNIMKPTYTSVRKLENITSSMTDTLKELDARFND